MAKPEKPYPEFPLFPHASGQWAKKIEGKTHYYGTWGDPMAALAKYQGAYGTTLVEVCGAFTKAKCLAHETGEICSTTLADYRRTCEWLVSFFGENVDANSLGPDMLVRYKEHMAQRRSLLSLGNEIARVRIVFKWGYDSGLLDKPVRWGPEFRRPSKRTMRRQPKAVKLFTPAQICAVLAEAGTNLKAMILLGVNCGYGPTDCALLSSCHILDGWAVYPRPKTGIERECPLWPETLAAIACVQRRSEGPSTFVQGNGRPYTQDVISKRFHAALRASGQTTGSFYWLRHVLETVGGGVRDQVALNRIMGHADASMAGVYRESIERERLERVASHVRGWLFGAGQ